MPVADAIRTLWSGTCRWPGPQGGRSQLKTLDLWFPEGDAPVVPGPAGEETSVVVEAVQQMLISGDLELPLGQPDSRNDRHLAMIIAALPDQIRKSLRFASFRRGRSRRLEPLGPVHTRGGDRGLETVSAEPVTGPFAE